MILFCPDCASAVPVCCTAGEFAPNWQQLDAILDAVNTGLIPYNGIAFVSRTGACV